MSALTATEVVLGALTTTSSNYAGQADEIVAALEAAGYIRPRVQLLDGFNNTEQHQQLNTEAR